MSGDVTNYAAQPDEFAVAPMPDDFATTPKRELRDGVRWVVVWSGTKEIAPIEYPVNDGLESHPEEEAHLRQVAWNCQEWFRMGRLDLLKGMLREPAK